MIVEAFVNVTNPLVTFIFLGFMLILTNGNRIKRNMNSVDFKCPTDGGGVTLTVLGKPSKDLAKYLAKTLNFPTRYPLDKADGKERNGHERKEELNQE